MSAEEAGSPQSVAPTDGGLGSHQQSIRIVWGLYLGSFLFPPLLIGGLAMAFIKRGGTSEPGAMSHYNKQIKVFWKLLIGLVVGLVLTLVLFGWFILLGVSIWLLVVSIKGMTAASEGKAYA